MNLYLPNGYLDIKSIIRESKSAFIFIIGGRGIGKTYGILQYLVVRKIKFIYMRRTQTELESVCEPDLNPFKDLNQDFGWNIFPLPINKNLYGFYYCERDDKGKWQAVSDPIALGVSLSTFSNIRGFGARDYTHIYYDEFIPEEHKARIRGEANAFFQAHESINRNRELNGEKPVIAICSANSNNICNPIFLSLKIVNILLKQFKNREYYIDKSRNLCIVNVEHSPISEMKKETALYQLTKNTSFYKMAIENNFNYKTFTTINSRRLVEYNPVVTVGELGIYEHKSRPEVYISEKLDKDAVLIGTSTTERIKLKKTYGWIWTAYINGYAVFENEMLEMIFVDYYTKSA